MVSLVIVGAGAAGMLAALCAADQGIRVDIFDPYWHLPSNLSLSGGLFPAAGSRLQLAAGIRDSPDNWLADLHAFAGASVNTRIAASVAHALPGVVDFLLDRVKTPVRFLPDVPAPGHSAVRFHSVMPASGPALNACLRAAVQAQGLITCHPDAGAGVNSVKQLNDGFELVCAGRSFNAAHLLLAGGGFGGSAVMVDKFIPEMSGALHSGSVTNDGSVIALARSWGAALAGMDGYQGQGHTHPGGHTRLGMSIPTLGGIMVDRSGERFVREDMGPSALAAKVLGRPGHVALEVFDEAIEAQLGSHSAYAAAVAAGKIMQADTLDELAHLAGVPAEALARNVALARQCAQGIRGATDPLGRKKFAHSLHAPYRASWVTGSLAHTQGGIVTDGQGQVLTTSEQPIAGLYAAGGCAAGLSGHGGDGYLPGNGLAQSFALAFNAVAAIANLRR